MESKDFLWSWNYGDHRVCIVLNECKPSQWSVKVSLECLQMHQCNCSSSLLGIEDSTFSSAKEALKTAERLACRYLDEHQD